MIPLGIYRTEKVAFDLGDRQPDTEREYEENENFMDHGNQNIEAEDSMDKKNSLDGSNGQEYKEMPKKEIKYVISNPDKELRLKENDVVFVLS